MSQTDVGAAAAPDSVRVGIIGAGGQGRIHAAAYAALPDVQLAAVAARTPSRAQALAQEHGATAVEAVDDLLHDPSIDAVSICAPTAFHTTLALTALEQGKHVLCETPLSEDRSDVAQLREAAAAADRLLLVGLTLLGVAESEAVQAAVAGGELGTVRAVYASRLAARFSETHYGDALSELMLFDIDLLNWILGPPDDVVATGVRGSGGAVDHAFVSLGYGPARAVCEASRLMPDSHGFLTVLRVVGDAGAIRLEFRPGDEQGPTVTLFPTDGTARRIEVPSRNPYAYTCRHFIRCIRGDADPDRFSVDRALHGLRVVDAARRSLAEGRAVALAEIE